MTKIVNDDIHADRALGRLLASRLARQTVAYTGGHALASVVALVASAIVARSVSAAEFGAYSFGVAFLLFVSLFFGFGLFAAASRMAALAPSSDRGQIVGAALLLYVPVGAAFALVTFGLSFLIDGWFPIDLSATVAVAALAGAAYPFVVAGQELSQGVDRLHVSSFGALFFQVVFVAALWFGSSQSELDATTALVLRSAALVVASLAIASQLRPAFHHLRSTASQIIRETRSYGFDVYIGRLLSIGTYNSDILLLGVWANPEDVGYYALAVALAGAAGLPVIGLASSLFARMARGSRIELRWIAIGWMAGGVLSLIAYAAARPFIELVFTDSYLDAFSLLVPLLVAQTIRGVTSFYNVFLAAHGRGRELRTAGFVLTVSNLAFNFALIPPFGAMGAAVAGAAALSVNLVMHIVLYRRSLSAD